MKAFGSDCPFGSAGHNKIFSIRVTKCSLTCRGHRIAAPEVTLHGHLPIYGTDHRVVGTGCSDQTDDLVC